MFGVRRGARTVCGWLPRGKGVVRWMGLVGRGHVYGVCYAAWQLRALMKSAGGEASTAIRPREMPKGPINGTHSQVLRSEQG